MTSTLGFGCVRLSSNYTKKQALRNLEVAYENGITHFDVAPLYGFGLAEGILGEFAKNKRDKITISTKFGIASNASILKNLFIQNVLRSAYRMLKESKLKKTAAQLSVHTKTATNFSVANAEHSLAHSLRELKTGYVDFLLLHEATIDEANKEDLLHFLDGKKREGVIKEFGIASFSSAIANHISQLNAAHSVLQTNNSFPFVPPHEIMQSKEIKNKFYFSPFLYLPLVKELLNGDKALAKELSDAVGFDVKAQLSDLFFMHQYSFDPKGIPLFTSNKNEKIVSAVQSWNRVKKKGANQFIGLPKAQQLIKARLQL